MGLGVTVDQCIGANGTGTVRRVLAPRRNDGAAAPHID